MKSLYLELKNSQKLGISNLIFEELNIWDRLIFFKMNKCCDMLADLIENFICVVMSSR